MAFIFKKNNTDKGKSMPTVPTFLSELHEGYHTRAKNDPEFNPVKFYQMKDALENFKAANKALSEELDRLRMRESRLESEIILRRVAKENGVTFTALTEQVKELEAKLKNEAAVNDKACAEIAALRLKIASVKESVGF